MTKGDQGATVTTQVQAAQHHALPSWLHWVQSHLFLSFLLLAEAYLLGDLMQRGWVENIEDFAHWGLYHGVGVVLFFAAGAMAAGVALQCSVTAAEAFQTRHPFLGLFNLVGVMVFAGSEIWASLSERSANLRPSPADQAVLAMLNVQGLPVSPTVVVVALLLPFATLYYGFSQRKPPEETTEERRERQERELAEARHKAELRAVRAGGLAGAARAAIQAATRDASATETSADGATYPDDDGGPSGGASAGEGAGVAGGKHLRPVRISSGTSALRGRITAAQLRDEVRERWGAEISEDAAVAFIRSLPDGGPTQGVQGRPVSAPKAQALARAKQKWGAQPQTQVAGA